MGAEGPHAIVLNLQDLLAQHLGMMSPCLLRWTKGSYARAFGEGNDSRMRMKNRTHRLPLYQSVHGIISKATEKRE